MLGAIAALAPGPAALPLVRVEGLTRIFDVSKRWLNRVIEGEQRKLLKAVQGLVRYRQG